MSTLVSVDWRVEGVLGHYFPLFFLPEFFFLDDVSDRLSLPSLSCSCKNDGYPGAGLVSHKRLSKARGRAAGPVKLWANPAGAVSPGSWRGHQRPTTGRLLWGPSGGSCGARAPHPVSPIFLSGFTEPSSQVKVQDPCTGPGLSRSLGTQIKGRASILNPPFPPERKKNAGIVGPGAGVDPGSHSQRERLQHDANFPGLSVVICKMEP